MIVTQLVFQSRRLEVCVARNWCWVEWDKFNALLWWTWDEGLLNRFLTDVELVEGAVASMIDSIQRVVDALVLLKRVCCNSWARWAPELTRLWHWVNSMCCHWITTGRVSAWEDSLMSHKLFRTTLSWARSAPWRRFCEETSAPNLWSLYYWMRRWREAWGVETLQ